MTGVRSRCPGQAHRCQALSRRVERLADGIVPDDEEGEPPLVPVLNRYKLIGTTAEVDSKTTRPCWETRHRHVDHVVADTKAWEQSATFRLEQQVGKAIKFYARNDHLGLVIPYEYQGIQHGCEPDFLVRLANDVTLVLEIKGQEDERDRAKHAAARRWKTAMNNWGRLGRWVFHPNKNPQVLGRDLERLVAELSRPARQAV